MTTTFHNLFRQHKHPVYIKWNLWKNTNHNMHLTSYVIVSLVLSQICKGVGMPLQYLNKYIKNGNVLPFNSFIYSWWSTWSPVIQDWFKFNSPRSPFYRLHFLVLIALKRLFVSTNLFPIELVFSGFLGFLTQFLHFCQTF